MVNRQMNKVVHFLRGISVKSADAKLSDGQLLQRYIDTRDEDAFALLVERHGAMVLGVSERVLQDRHDAEDVFQATFLVLAHRADSIRKKESVASWLYGVAYRTARKSKSRATLQKRRETQCNIPPTAEQEADVLWHDLRPILDEELSRLPEKYRTPVVLCYLEGKTNEQAAKELGWTKGTVSGRLARARALLRSRLRRRGLAIGVGMMSALLGGRAGAATVAPALWQSLAPAIASSARAGLIGGGSTKAIFLAKGVLRAMLLSKIKLVFTVLLAVGVISGSIGLLTVNSNAESAGQGFILGSEKQGAASVADRERLQGSWRTIEAKRGGAKRPEMIVLKLTFEGKKVQLSMGAEKKQGSFRLYPDKSPKRIDLFVDGEKGMGIGIYKFQGDKLYLCVDDYNNSRPNSFTSAAGSEHAFLILQRTAGGAAKLDQAEVDALRKENEQLRKQLAVTQDELLKMKAFLQQIKAREQQKQAQLQELLKLQKLNEIRLKQAEEQAKKEFEKAQKALQLEKLLQQLETEKKLQALQQAKTAQQKAAAAAQAPKATRASVKNLRSIGVAMHNYHDVHKRLPASTIYSDSGKPLLSWRVAILPYLNQTQLYKQFKLNEPWNSPHNLKLLEQMPKIYAPVAGQGHEKNETYYQVFTGPKTLFDGSTGKRFIDVRDGTSNTVMVVEAGTAVPWTKPADLNYSPGKPLPKLGGLFDGMNILLADGSTTFIPAQFNEAMFRRLITIGDGHPLDLEQLRSPETTSKEQ